MRNTSRFLALALSLFAVAACRDSLGPKVLTPEGSWSGVSEATKQTMTLDLSALVGSVAGSGTLSSVTPGGPPAILAVASGAQFEGSVLKATIRVDNSATTFALYAEVARDSMRVIVDGYSFGHDRLIMRRR